MTEFNEPNNPFTPVFGKVPAVLAGRTTVIDNLLGALESGGSSPDLCSIISGVRGSGKTTLLQYVKFRAEELGWIVASVTAQSGMLEDILQRVRVASDHLVSQTSNKKLKSVNFMLVGVTWENKEEPSLNFRSQITNLLDELENTNTGILFMVDELDGNLDEMVKLATTFQHLIGEEKKVALFMAGLPYNISSLLNGKTTSFMRRAARFLLDNLKDYEVEEAFRLTIEQGGKEISEEALELAIQKIQGFPFMLQLVGYRSWVAAGLNKVIEIEHVEQGSRVANKELEERVFSATIGELTKGDREFLKAMNKDESVTTREQIAEKTGRSSSWVSKYKRRLLESGVIEETLLGDLQFALPDFAAFLTKIGI